MRVGIDFDNTIAGYDELFADLAVAHGYLPFRPEGGKAAVREMLRRQTAGECAWRHLQALAYGPHMHQAILIDGVAAFVAACRERGVPVVVISHKSRRAWADADGTDLHGCARNWMASHGFFEPDGLGLSGGQVYFEESREAKLGRIAEQGCTHFIDDLAEVLGHPAFPPRTERYLFAPAAAADGHDVPFRRCRSWSEIRHGILGA